MYNNLVINISNGTELAASDLAVDISTTVNTSDGSFSFTKDNDGSSNFTNSRIIERFVSSSMYRRAVRSILSIPAAESFAETNL